MIPTRIPAGIGVVAVAATLMMLSACRKDVAITDPLPDLLAAPIRPAHFPPAHYQFEGHPYSKAGFELGRRLFADPLLSVDNSISCISCHRQEAAFSDAGQAFSTGVQGRLGTRNSPPVFNMAWNRSFMWDGGVNHIEVMPFAPITDPLEMDEDLLNVLRKLNDHPAYPALFQEVFDRSPIDDQQLFLALAQYMGNLVSADSPYDRHVTGAANLRTNERNGLDIFRANCGSCHAEPLFSDQGFHNNGLDTAFADPGRYRITQDPGDMGRFKVPTLRNVALTAPYMHDGRFATLEQVVEHYSTGLKESPTLADELRGHGAGMAFSPQEKADLVAFLHALTDPVLITDGQLGE
jgi:cytochrome c peroxidase